MRKFLYLILLCILLSKIVIAQVKGKVVSVADGDSFTLIDSLNAKHKVRLYGIDCPEKGQEFFKVAKQATGEHILGKMAALDIKQIDRYGRKVAIVYILPDSAILNIVLLEQGLAWHYKAYDKNPKWSQMEKCARQKGLGLWKHKHPVAPWIYRTNTKTRYRNK